MQGAIHNAVTANHGRNRHFDCKPTRDFPAGALHMSTLHFALSLSQIDGCWRGLLEVRKVSYKCKSLQRQKELQATQRLPRHGSIGPDTFL